jgi:hypothetical protein
VAEAIGARTTLVAAGLLGGAITLAFLFLPGMRDIERRGLLAGVRLETAPEAVEPATTLGLVDGVLPAGVLDPVAAPGAVEAGPPPVGPARMHPEASPERPTAFP